MVVLALLGVLILFSSTPQASGIAAAPLVTSVSTAPLVQNSIKPRQTLQVGPTVDLTPSTAAVGETITVTLSGYPPNSLIFPIKIAGLVVTLPSPTPTTSPAGDVAFAFVVPLRALSNAKLPAGPQTFEVFAGGAPQGDAILTIVLPLLSLSEQTIVANQDLTISGSLFTEGGGVCVVEGNITFNNVALEIDDASDCPASILIAAGASEGILLTNGGTFTLAVRVHDVDGSTPPLSTLLLTEGFHELKVIDTNGAIGTIFLEIPNRSLQVTPLFARVGDVVTVTGPSFIASNPDGLSTSVDVKYVCGPNSTSVIANPDISGDFQVALSVPINCAIPSTNIVRATIIVNGLSTGVVETVTHPIPDALVTIEPGRGISGSLVTVSGTGFRSFESVELLEFGGLDALSGQMVDTDASGNFIIPDVVVPILHPGIHAFSVKVGTGENQTSTSTSFEVLEGGPSPSCVLPNTGGWIISKSCTVSGNAIAPENVIVEQNLTLTIAENAALDIDFTTFHLLIKSGAKVVIKIGGKIH